MDVPYQIIKSVEAVRDIKNIVDPQIYSYSSIQLDLPKGFARQILLYGLTIPDEDIKVDEEDFDIGREENPHVTVMYGLDTSNIKEVKCVIGTIHPVTIELGDVSFFENKEKDYDVLKVDVVSEDLMLLHNKIKKSLKASGNTFKIYKPHITIAYLKIGKGKKYKGDSQFRGKKITFSELCFSHNGKFDYISFV